MNMKNIFSVVRIVPAMVILSVILDFAGERPLAAESQPLYVADQRGIWQTQDGANVLFQEGSFADLAVSRSGAVYAIESDSGRVWKFEDLNADRDALDEDEKTAFRDEKAMGFHLRAPISIAVAQRFDPDIKELKDVVFVMDANLQATVKLEDVDSDGTAQEADEICIFHQSTIEKPMTAVQMITEKTGRLLAINPNLPGVLRVIDLNQDCTATVAPKDECPLEAVFNEYHVVKDDNGIDPDLAEPFGIAVSDDDVIFVSDWQRDKSPGAILRLEDLNDDEDTQDADEVTVFSDGICQGVKLVFEVPTGVAVDEQNAVYVADYNLGMIFRFEDLNGDNDALDSDECIPYAKDFSLPVGLGIQPPLLSAGTIKPKDGIEDLVKGNDLLLPEGTSKSFLIQVVGREDGTPLSGVKVLCDPLSGCLQCEPKTVLTNEEGSAKFEVARLLEASGNETIAVSVFGDTLFINVTPDIDSDLDGEPDSVDNCPATANPDQSDRDGDGIGDACDADTGTDECPFTFAMEGSSQKATILQLLRKLRDEYLAQNPKGSYFIRLFYQNSAEVMLLLRKNPELRLQTRTALEHFRPQIKAVLEGQPAILTSADVTRIVELLDAIKVKANPLLQGTIREIASDVHSSTLFPAMGIGTDDPL